MLLIIAEHGLLGSMDKEDGLGHKMSKISQVLAGTLT